ncbi:hypothetical protein [uncultured Paracoccus sp.]|uniref:hypothetical protein n=1 Tax=uncultured Paracoccus sp. TaxID=189685 RepID=UPI002638AADA|nr:hypothetical protein [uncultured Paracoccus sp.]
MLHRAVVACALTLLSPAAFAQGYTFEMPRADQSTPPVAIPDGQQPPTEPEAPDIDETLDGSLDTIFDNLFRRAEPHLQGLAQELQGTFGELAPAFRELGGLIDDIGNYEPPERLPNGDILIRRRADAPPPPPLEELPNLLPRGDDTERESPWSVPTAPVDPDQPQIDL